MKQQIQKVIEDSKKKDTTNKLAIERLRKQHEEASNKINDLNRELKTLEELRLKSLGNIIIKKEKSNKNIKAVINPVKAQQISNSVNNSNNYQTNSNLNTNSNSYQTNNNSKSN